MKKYLIISLLILSSCGKFLEPKSQTEYVPRDAASLNEMLIGEAYIDASRSSVQLFSMNEIFSDDWGMLKESSDNTDNQDKYVRLKPIYAWHPDMFILARQHSGYYAIWRETYSHILGCNAALDYIDDMIGTEHEKAYVKGQALALRAFYYFNLVNLFGEPYYYNKEALGVPLKLDSNMELTALSRNTVEEVYEQMKEDLNRAEQYFRSLPEEKHFTRDGRVTLPMIEMTRARLALFMEEWETVVDYSTKVIEDWGLSLLDLNSFISTSSAPYYSFTSQNNPEAAWLFGSATDFSTYTGEYVYLNPLNNTTRRLFNASDALLNSYSANDLRKENYIIKESVSVSNLRPLGKLPVTTTYAPTTNMFGRALRVSEAYLMLAEASYMLKDEATAIEALEEIRKNRFSSDSGDEYVVPTASKTGEALYTFIKEERRREMCFEGLRWFDLRRWGMESFSREWREDGDFVQTFVIEKNDPAFTLPIPQEVMDANPNLVQNKLSTPKY